MLIFCFYPSYSNKLTKIQDLTSGNADLGDFRDGTNTDDDYEYWLDGSLKRDKNKKISLTYNYLKLPEKVTFDNGRTITTEYDAEGTKLKKIDSNGETTDYEEDEIYVNDVLYQTSHDEGRIVDGIYEYNITDHLGNLRVAFKDSSGIAKITQVNAYGAWGEELPSLSYRRANPNNFTYQEKEFSNETGEYDFETRMYDPIIGRMRAIDFKAELMPSNSPLSFCFNNPIRFTDPDGQVPGEYYNEQGTKIGDDGKNDNKIFVVKTTQTNVNPNNTQGVSSSNPITQEAAATTENEIRNGNFSGVHMNNLVQLESASIMSKMLDIVSKDDGTGGGKPENNREYGGSVSKRGVIKEAKPGDVTDLSTASRASIAIPTNQDTKSKFHSHPSDVLTTQLPNNRLNLRFYEQAPSMTDVNGMSGRKIDYEFGMRASTIFIYNKTGVIATIPFSTFKKP